MILPILHVIELVTIALLLLAIWLSVCEIMRPDSDYPEFEEFDARAY